MVNDYAEPERPKTMAYKYRVKHGRTSVEDGPRSEGLKSATTPPVSKKNVIRGIGRPTIEDGLHCRGHEHLRRPFVPYFNSRTRYETLCARWMPHLLSCDQKVMRMKVSAELFGAF